MCKFQEPWMPGIAFHCRKLREECSDITLPGKNHQISVAAAVCETCQKLGHDDEKVSVSESTLLRSRRYDVYRSCLTGGKLPIFAATRPVDYTKAFKRVEAEMPVGDSWSKIVDQAVNNVARIDCGLTGSEKVVRLQSVFSHHPEISVLLESRLQAIESAQPE